MTTLSNQRILVTGFTGRLGGAFTEALAKDNDVVAVALAATPAELDRWRTLGVEPHVLDLGSDDYADLPNDFDYVVHTAAAVYPPDFATGMRANAEAPALLMRHVRSAKAFLHVSTTGVYAPNPDPWYRPVETDVTGGSLLMGHYTGTKNAGEGAVRAMARILSLPTVICRMDVQYGTYADGGLPVKYLADLIAGRPIGLPETYDWVKSLIHQDDLVAFIGPCLDVASVPAITVNWSGDEQLKGETFIDYMADLVGVAPVYDYNDDLALPGGAASPALRQTITGPAKVSWQDGLSRIVDFWAERLRNDIT